MVCNKTTTIKTHQKISQRKTSQMKYFDKNHICKCGFETFSKKAWTEHQKTHGQQSL